MQQKTPILPSEMYGRSTFFKRVSSGASRIASKPIFFLFCLFLVIVWAPTYFIIGDVDTWQLIINTATTIITFLMVALLQPSQARDMRAIHVKLNAMADAQRDFMLDFSQHISKDNGKLAKHIQADVDELEAAVGLEDRD